MRLGHGVEVRRCKYTNYCEALDQAHAVVTCQLWDRQGLDEPGLLKSPDGKRRRYARAQGSDWTVTVEDGPLSRVLLVARQLVR